jgi:hypothetical protein
MKLVSKIAIVTLLFLVGCMPGEEPITPKPRLNKSISVDAGPTKNTVTFISLEKDTILAEASPEMWDFYITEDVIKLNFFRSMEAAVFTEDWTTLKDTNGLVFNYLTNKQDSQWVLLPNTNYVINFGIDDAGQPMGFYKLRYTLNEGYKSVYFTSLSNATEQPIEVQGAGYFSMATASFTPLPLEEEYDIAFGKYKDFVVFPDEQADYIVYGVVQGNVKAALLMAPFEQVNIGALDTVDFNNNLRNVIGWDWKRFNLDAGGYTIKENKTYLLETAAGYFYKFRFVDFYNEDGVSGHPTFEYKLL